MTRGGIYGEIQPELAGWMEGWDHRNLSMAKGYISLYIPTLLIVEIYLPHGLYFPLLPIGPIFSCIAQLRTLLGVNFPVLPSRGLCWTYIFVHYPVEN